MNDDSYDYEGEEEEDGGGFESFDKPNEKITFFSDLSMQELVFGVGSIGVNGLCLGMMLNIPTLTLHNLMYKVQPLGLLDKETSDQDRIAVTKAIIDYWLQGSAKLKRKDRFKQLHQVFVCLKETEIAEALKQKFETDDQISLEMFHKFDLGRLGPYVPPDLDQLIGDWGEEEGYYEEEEAFDEGA